MTLERIEGAEYYARRLGVLLAKGDFERARHVLEDAEQAAKDHKKDTDPLTLAIVDLDLSHRVKSVLQKNLGILFVRQLVQQSRDELLATPQISTKSIASIDAVLASLGLEFACGGQSWVDEDPEDY